MKTSGIKHGSPEDIARYEAPYGDEETPEEATARRRACSERFGNFLVGAIIATGVAQAVILAYMYWTRDPNLLGWAKAEFLSPN